MIINDAMKKVYFILICFTLLLVACDDKFLNETYIQSTGEDIELSNAEYLSKNADMYSLFIELLKYADFYNALNDANSVSTVFAPTDSAMKVFLKWKGVTDVTELDKDYARNVAEVHVLNYKLNSSSFVDYVETGTIPVKTIFGSYLTASYGRINRDVDDKYLDEQVWQDTTSIYLNNEASVENLAVATSNGVVYTLGGVIHPLAETIKDILIPYNEYNIFVEAIEKTGYDSLISIYADTVINEYGGYSVTNYNFTCFAVPDSIYRLNGISDFAGLAGYLGAGSNYKDSANAVNRYLKYHFFSTKELKSDLFDISDSGQINIFDTNLDGEVVTFEKDNNGEELINGSIKIIKSDIAARNGVIHKINNIMPVYAPAPMPVKWDFTNYPDIISMVNTYGAGRNLGDLFVSDLSNKEYYIDLTEDRYTGDIGTATSFTYEYNETKSSAKSYNRVGFMKCRYASTKDKVNNSYGAYKDNLLILNLGYAGWVQFTTPTIIKGKYKIEFYYGASASLKDFYASGSLTKFSLDGNEKKLYVWKGIPGKFIDESKQSSTYATGIARDVLWNSYEFDTSGKHTFKATLMDINAKTHRSYRQMWDYILFTPID